METGAGVKGRALGASMFKVMGTMMGTSPGRDREVDVMSLKAHYLDQSCSPSSPGHVLCAFYPPSHQASR